MQGKTCLNFTIEYVYIDDYMSDGILSMHHPCEQYDHNYTHESTICLPLREMLFLLYVY
jgi:hypothetical protein